ncbi:MAG: S8 family serine peptidase, partial [Eudoraea sp.]|nr:S8 family serine peptidase [Eudoraea sp.]
IPGISLEKAYELINQRQPDTVVIAVLDMTIDINHEDLSDFIWQNMGEVADNGIDDDKNGYIDDKNGWNFIGWKNGQGSQFVNYEYTRIIRKYDSVFQGKSKESIENAQVNDYAEYKRAQDAFTERMSFAKAELENAMTLITLNNENKSILSQYLGTSPFSLEKLDSLGKSHPSNIELNDAIELRKELLLYGILDSQINEDHLKAEERINKLLNLAYNDRKPVGDLFPEDVSYRDYGSNNISYNTKLLDHGTKVAGVIAANRKNQMGAKGVTNAVKIMPLSVSAYGDEHDKDMALAIRYAADNGAKIINISSSKRFSMHQEWVSDAIKYAFQNDVLIITSAGNEGINLDDKANFNYPNDTNIKGQEFAANFIKVGSSTYRLGNNLFDIDSNYGLQEVDILAPGEDIYTTEPTNNYGFDSGTSFAAPIVTVVAALIRAYYPELSAQEVKKIIMASGIQYDLKVNIANDEEKQKLVPFTSLTKSGKIVNAYYALKLAEQYSRN